MPLPQPNVRDGDWLRALWEGDSLGSRAARVALMPAELLFGAGSALRSTLYSSGVLSSHPTPIPALSVGNLTVGGTGKTPIAAYLARTLLQRGAKPAIVLRGYGDDEPLVHRALNPDVQVVVSADRLAGIVQAMRAENATQEKRPRARIDSRIPESPRPGLARPEFRIESRLR